MQHLTSPLTVGALNLHNRLVLPPMATAKSAADGKVTDALCAYYAEKAHGGYVGLVITEHCYVNLQGKASEGQLSIADDSDIPGLTRLVDTIHAAGSKAICQLNHAGGYAIGHITGLQNLSATGGPMPSFKQTDKDPPVEMTQGDIDHVVACFADAARRAKSAGYDGVEIHSAHAYLLNQFYSPLSNQRTDSYGGALTGRIKLHLEVIAAVRRAVGPDYPIALRLGGCDYREGGSTIADAVEACEAFAAAGVDLLDISGGFCSYQKPGDNSPGWFRDLTVPIKAAVDIPVILTGGVKQAADAEALLAEGCADLIGVGRALLLDSDWAEKAMKAC